ncbi:MAG: single-stranded DNA-binding protein [Bacilli bacterium]
MNKVVLVGRITKDPELKRTGSDIPYVQFTVAVNRPYKNNTGERQADFIGCVAWRQTAEVISKYVRKGQQIGVDGSIQTRSYDDSNGVKHYVTEVLVENFHFIESKKEDSGYNDYSSGGYNQQYNQSGPQYTQNPQSRQQNYGSSQQPNRGYTASRSYNQTNEQTQNRGQNPQKPKDIFDDIDNQFVSDDDLPF